MSLGWTGGIVIDMKDEAREKQEFEVFLSHNSQDTPGARAMVECCAYWCQKEELGETEECGKGVSIEIRRIREGAWVCFSKG